MSFNSEAFSEYVSDPRYDVLKKQIKVDKDNKAYELQFIAPATAQGTFAKNAVMTGGTGVTPAEQLSVPCFNNDGSQHYIDVYTGSDYKANMQGTHLMIKYKCYQARVLNGDAFWGRPIAPLATAGASIPWNPMWMFNTIALKGNQSQSPVEQYVNSGQLHHITTAKFLQKYKKDCLEQNDMTFLTPCMESGFDITGAMSAESVTRGTRWMGAIGLLGDASAAGNNLASVREFQKIIPLADIFESCEVPAIWNNLNRFRLEFTMKLPDQIAIQNTLPANSSPVYVCVTEVKLMFDSSRMQAVTAIETAVEKQQGTIENIGHFENFVIPMTYTASQQLVGTGQRDVQQIIVGFPAMGNITTAINPIQYCHRGLTGLSVQYGSDMPLRSPLSLGGDNVYANTSAYALYRKSCGADRMTIVSPALRFVDFPYYHLYFIPVYNPAFAHRTGDPRDVRIDATIGAIATGHVAAVNVPAIMILRKFSGKQIDSTGNISTM